jgi:uncharacterized damage-inducible protein DinB
MATPIDRHHAPRHSGPPFATMIFGTSRAGPAARSPRGRTLALGDSDEQAELSSIWNHFRQCHGITLRAIAALPADQLDGHPIPNMRTPKELIVHLYGDVVRGMVEGVMSGDFDHDLTRAKEKKTASTLKTHDDVLRFTRDSWTAADRAFDSITDAQLQEPVKTPFGFSLPGGVLLHMQKDEYLHHRGQLYAFARALGVEPPMIWDFANNEPAFRPKTAADTS